MLTAIRNRLRGRFLWLKNPLEKAYRRVVRRNYQYVDWPAILALDSQQWRDAVEKARSGPKILIATGTGGKNEIAPVESMLAVALTLRGANVHFLLCDGLLPACIRMHSGEYDNQMDFLQESVPSKRCAECFWRGADTYRPLGLTIHRYSELVTAEEKNAAAELARNIRRPDLLEYQLDGISVGEHAMSGALRYLAVGTLDQEPHGEGILRRHFHAALLTTYAVRRLCDRFHFESACVHHGIYVPQGSVSEVVRQKKVRVVTWMPAYRKQCFIFSHDDTYHHTLMSEKVDSWENMPWTERMESQIVDYLNSRRLGKQDWITFQSDPHQDVAKIAQELNIDFSKPTVGLLTNVIWDAQLHYPTNIFPNMVVWLLQTIDYFSRRPDLQLVIRVHPAEITGAVPSRQLAVREIRQAFPRLPPNIFVIPPESTLSTYTVMEQCDSVIIYGTKTGVELSSLGIPVIVAGEAWIRNKGITIDPPSAEEYFRTLERLPLRRRMGDTEIRRGRRYAYHFFFRRMIPLSMTEAPTGFATQSGAPGNGAKGNGTPGNGANGNGLSNQVRLPLGIKIRVSRITELLPGQDKGLDVVCDGLLSGKPFIYPAEQFHVS